jgi:hypothetical protein
MNDLGLVRVKLRVASGLIAPFFLLTVAASASEPLHLINAKGSTELTFKTVKGSAVRVTVEQTKLETSYPYKGALLWGGDVGSLPQTILSAIEINADKKTIFIPLSAYSDLGDVKAASFATTPQGFVLNFHGGHTAASYDATLTFSMDYLVSRIVALREFPDERRERTTYKFPTRSRE